MRVVAENLHDDLRVEYQILQGHYEQFDARALTIKSWSAPLLAGGIGLGFSKDSMATILAAIFTALVLWILEAIWKKFQYCYTDRIKLIEFWFSGQHSEEIVPFQIYTAWDEAWERYFRHPSALLPILRQPFVYLPYLPISIFGTLAFLSLIAMPTPLPSAP